MLITMQPATGISPMWCLHEGTSRSDRLLWFLIG